MTSEVLTSVLTEVMRSTIVGLRSKVRMLAYPYQFEYATILVQFLAILCQTWVELKDTQAVFNSTALLDPADHLALDNSVCRIENISVPVQNTVPVWGRLLVKQSLVVAYR